ncbi:hypothetical protein GCM10025783_11900 [Amnibacterium soli]|uniref:Uncharacterized protein n=1 Tax=Amnibacterium soli TaxID=1282736 RepID=A0ABP8YZG4_9MICO
MLLHLRDPEAQRLIDEVNQPGRSSGEVQATILGRAASLGFRSEARGLFSDYSTPGLRPDYFLELPAHETGILLEVERGKTTINNMDLLDFWKCHICVTADHLFLMVPQRLQQNLDASRITRPFDYVKKRLPTFFSGSNYTNVRSAWLFGY